VGFRQIRFVTTSTCPNGKIERGDFLDDGGLAPCGNHATQSLFELAWTSSLGIKATSTCGKGLPVGTTLPPLISWWGPLRQRKTGTFSPLPHGSRAITKTKKVQQNRQERLHGRKPLLLDHRAGICFRQVVQLASGRGLWGNSWVGVNGLQIREPQKRRPEGLCVFSRC